MRQQDPNTLQTKEAGSVGQCWPLCLSDLKSFNSSDINASSIFWTWLVSFRVKLSETEAVFPRSQLAKTGASERVLWSCIWGSGVHEVIKIRILLSPWQSGSTTLEMARHEGSPTIGWRWSAFRIVDPAELWTCSLCTYSERFESFLFRLLISRRMAELRWRIFSEERGQISLKWPPSDCPCHRDSLWLQRSALTSTRMTASIPRSLNNRRVPHKFTSSH